MALSLTQKHTLCPSALVPCSLNTMPAFSLFLLGAESLDKKKTSAAWIKIPSLLSFKLCCQVKLSTDITQCVRTSVFYLVQASFYSSFIFKAISDTTVLHILLRLLSAAQVAYPPPPRGSKFTSQRSPISQVIVQHLCFRAGLLISTSAQEQHQNLASVSRCHSGSFALPLTPVV